MSFNAKCLLDMDGVLVDFLGGSMKFHGLPDRSEDPDFLGVWDFVKKSNIDAGEFWGPLGQEFWANLEPTPEFPEIIGLVEGIFGLDNICLLSSPCENHGCVPGKMQWIERHMPKYKRRFLIGPRKEFCANKTSVLVDDSDANIETFVSHGGLGVLVPRPWNSLYHLRKNLIEHVEKSLLKIKSDFLCGF